jgi:hypothetical protein
VFDSLSLQAKVTGHHNFNFSRALHENEHP